jgi:hypothetical protein
MLEWEMDGFGSCEHMGRVGPIEGRGMLLASGSGPFSRLVKTTVARKAREVEGRGMLLPSMAFFTLHSPVFCCPVFGS